VLVVSGLGGFDDRVEAIHCGADGCFPKPIDVEAMLRRMHHLIDRNRTTPSRILSVEDEPEQAALIRAVLESAGYEVRICRGSKEFAGDLDSFRPNLVLMDARLPDTSGYELARYIRQEERHAALPVIFLTAEALTSHRIDALRAGGDDYLTKPVIPSLLLSVVGARLERARFLEMLLLRDGLTRLLTHTAFFESVRSETVRLLERGNPTAMLVLIDVDGFKGINEQHGHLAGDRVLASLAAILRRRFRQTDTIGRTGGDEFGILLQDLRADEAAALMERVRAEFAAVPHADAEGAAFRATFSAGVASLAPGVDFRTWTSRAEAALLEARTNSGNRVVSGESVR
jgi:diguanylate cyclase (GGDEF)-like protein